MAYKDIKTLLFMISKSIEDVEDDLCELESQQIKQLYDTLTPIISLLPNKNKLRIIQRASDYYPSDTCSAEWINNVIKFYISGWCDTYVIYRYENDLYYKESIHIISVNGRRKDIHESYDNSIGLTEDEVLREISTMSH